MSISAKESRKDAPLSPKRIVVTGGGGFLGGVVVRKLYDRGCRMIVAPPRTRYDLSSAEDVAGLLNRVQPEVLVHLAASENPSSDGESLRDFCNNVLMTTQVMEAACRRGVGKMICLGSASCYPADAPQPLREEHLFNGLPEPAELGQGLAKRLSLIQAQICRREYGFPCVFLIPTSFYGPGDHFDSRDGYMIPMMIRKIVEAVELNSAEVVLPGDGRSTHDFLHVEDCAEGILLAIEKYSGGEAVNLASGEEVRLTDLAGKIADLAGYSGRITWDGTPCTGASGRLLETSKASREFGFHPQIGLDDGLRETLESYRASRAERANGARQRASLSRTYSNVTPGAL